MLKQIDKSDFIISKIVKEILMDFHRNTRMSEDVERRKTTFIIRKDLLEKAEKLGLLGRNLSFFVEKFLEKFLDDYQSLLEDWTTLTPGVGFEPTRPLRDTGSPGPRLTTRQPRLKFNNTVEFLKSSLKYLLWERF